MKSIQLGRLKFLEVQSITIIVGHGSMQADSVLEKQLSVLSLDL